MKYGFPSFLNPTASKWEPFFIFSEICSAAADENKNVALKKCEDFVFKIRGCANCDEISDNLEVNKKNYK